MTLKTFNFSPRSGAAGDIEPVVRSVQFGDGYKQTSGDGINSETESWPLTFVGRWDYIKSIINFLKEHKGYRSFKWRNPMYQLGLYQAGKYTVSAAGVYFTLTVTFTRSYHP